jgi:hypothetical protein
LFSDAAFYKECFLKHPLAERRWQGLKNRESELDLATYSALFGILMVFEN